MKLNKSHLQRMIREELQKIDEIHPPGPSDEFDKIVDELRSAGLIDFADRLETWFETIRYDLPDPLGDEYNKHKRFS